MEKPSLSRLKAFALPVLAAFTCLSPWLAAQDVTVMPPALFDTPGNPNQPDTPPALRKEWSPVFPDGLRATTEPSYIIFTQRLDEKGKRTSRAVNDLNTAFYDEAVSKGFSDLQYTPAQKGGKPAESWSWFGVIFNPASASDNAANATPRLLKVAPVFVTLEQWIAFPKGPRVVRGSIDIDTAGAAKNFKLEGKASYARAVRPAIERSLAKWQFAPARKDGQPVAASLQLDFVLQVAPNPKVGDKMPEVIKQTRPIYPRAMKNSGMVGEVTLNFVVDFQGYVQDPSIVRSNNPNFESPAIDAVLEWKFKPGIKNGVPVNSRMQIPISFSLVDDFGRSSDVKTAYGMNAPTKKQTAQMPDGLRYDVSPNPRGVIYPVYPYEMLLDGKKGEATVAMLVTSRGVVAQIAVATETAPEFGYAALAACEYFEFTPAKLDWMPTDAVTSIKLNFNSDSVFVTDEDRDMLRLEKKSPQKIIAAGKLDATPKRIVTRQPPFPLAALQENITEGEAVVEFLIDTEGKVRLPRIVSSTHPSFGYIAVQTIANWRYEPPKSQGKPVITRARMPFGFAAKDDAPSGD